jgi:YYY domain-containing protein
MQSESEEAHATGNTPAPPTSSAFAIWRARLAAFAARVDWSAVALGAVVIIAFWLRVYNINWDDNAHLHPDEREITLVAQCLGLKSSPPGCTPVSDPANPHFFAYGSFPLYLLALVAHGLAHLFANRPGLPTDGGTFDDYNHFTLVGRALSALFDTGTVLVTGLLARRLVGRWWGLFAAAFLAFTAFEVQVSHFYAVDTVLTFFVTLTLFGALGLAGFRRERIAPDRAPGAETAAAPMQLPHPRVTIAWSLLTGLAFGLAITSKVSALPLLAPIMLALGLRWRKLGLGGWPDILLSLVTTATTAILTIVVTMPYMFLDPTQFWSDVNLQSALAKGTIVYPYTIQFAGRTPYLDQLKNLFIWDMGFGLALAGCLGVLYAVWRVWRHWDDVLIVPLAWLAIYFGITGGFYTKFSRYQLPNFPVLALLATVMLADVHRRLRTSPAPLSGNRGWRALVGRVRDRVRPVLARYRVRQWLVPVVGAGIILSGALLTTAFLQIYAEPMTRLAASDWIYHNIPSGSTITHEVWDDELPLPRPSGAALSYQFLDLNLYDPDTTDKTQQLANSLAKADVIIVASNRLVASIARVPDTYPMTNHYYQLLFHDGLGFHLAKEFQNYPHLGFFQLPDAQADESFSVYDHPTVWIFTRDPGTAMTADQIDQRLLTGVTMPPVVTSLASQKPLLLTPQQIAADQATAPLWQTFNPAGLATKLALPLWWLAIELLGLFAFPLAYLALPGLRDRGWGLAKALGVLLLSFFIWLPANLNLLPYERGTVWLAGVALAGVGLGIFWRHRSELLAFFRANRNRILLTEGVVLAAFLFFVFIRSLDPDLWHLYRGGEKPMELAFLNGILRSRTLPPLDPWFAGGAINYYYFGQFLIATLIQLTGIVPTTAFNLAIPMLFALTISGAISVVGGITGRWWVGAVAGWFLAVAGNLDGLRQFWAQLQQYLAHLPVIPFDYWASSRVIPFTINEFPFWSFLYSDLHAHVIDLPIVLIGLGTAASLLNAPFVTRRDEANGANINYITLGVAALALGAMACINTWDAPTYGIIIVIALLAAEWRHLHIAVAQSEARGWPAWRAQITWARIRRVSLSLIGLGVGAIGLYLPFYLHFQSFVNGIGPVTTPTDPILFLTLFGLWLFIIVTFFVLEINRRWELRMQRRSNEGRTPSELMADSTQRALALTLMAVIVLTFVVLGGVKTMLIAILAVGIFLALDGRHSPAKQFTYLLILAGAALALMVEVIYVRDFLDNSDWERMNTVFKFYYQVWLLLALGAAMATRYIFRELWPSGMAFSAPREKRTSAASGRTRAARMPMPEVTALVTPQPEATGAVAGATLALHIGDTDEMPAIMPHPTATMPTNTDAETVEHAADDAEPPWPTTSGGDTDAHIPSWHGGEDGGAELVGWGLRGAWLAILAILVFGSSVFLYEGTSVRVQDRTNWGTLQPVNALQSVPSLDGFAYMKSWFPGDAAAITWINENISGAPVILEASADPYQWYGRVSIYTGLPAVLGWASHESQQRYPDEVYARQPDVTAMYTVGQPAQVLPLLHQYHVQYVYVGQLECLAYAVNDPTPTTPSASNVQTCAAHHDVMGPLTVFDQLAQQGATKVVYQTDSVTIWQVIG